MSQVTISMTFNSAEEALAFLSGKSGAATEAVKLSKTAPKADAAATKPSADSDQKPEPAVQEKSDVTYDFDKDIVPALKAYAAKVPREKFAELMAKCKATKVPEIKEKPELFTAIMKTCNAA